MKVINLYAGPGTGKSTTASDLFQQMKKLDYKVELVTEYAKDMVYEGRGNILEDQLYVFAKQNRRVSRLEGKVDFVITDSPLLLSLVYADNSSSFFSTFASLVIETYFQYDNLNFFLNRTKKYHQYGRNQTEEQAIELDSKILKMLDQISKYKKLDYKHILCNNDAASNILKGLQL